MTKGRRRTALTRGVAALAGALVALIFVLRWRRNPSACPYGLRFLIELPRPFVTRARLRDLLAPRPTDKLLEIGPGTGYYSLPVAGWLNGGGTLDVLDLQQEMLDHVMSRARERGIENMIPTKGDARALPYPDRYFDAAYLTLVLGEIPDQDAALRELKRVLKRGGHLVVGELFPDLHMVPFGALEQRAQGAGFEFERKAGGILGYFARFRVP
jgi:ubiquinone/menaquinone biosynthesis C-methylase UbiE